MIAIIMKMNQFDHDHCNDHEYRDDGESGGGKNLLPGGRRGRAGGRKQESEEGEVRTDLFLR